MVGWRRAGKPGGVAVGGTDGRGAQRCNFAQQERKDVSKNIKAQEVVVLAYFSSVCRNIDRLNEAEVGQGEGGWG